MMEERELFERYRETGDVSLRNLIAEKYLPVAAVIAKKFVGRGVEYDDLYQVAALALVKGVERFDPALGVKFSTFITPTITGEIKNYFRDRSRLIHLPRKISELKAEIKRAEGEMTAELGRSPTARELSERLNLSEEEIVRCAEAGATVSLDASVEDRDGASFYDVLPAKEESGYEELERRDAVESAIQTLSEAERTLIRLRYEEELSQTQTAKIMHVSQMYVSRLERKVLEKLRGKLGKGMA